MDVGMGAGAGVGAGVGAGIWMGRTAESCSPMVAYMMPTLVCILLDSAMR